MLILDRGVREGISIAGGLVHVVVIHAAEGFVRLGFRAPRDIEILRDELVHAVDDDPVPSTGIGTGSLTAKMGDV